MCQTSDAVDDNFHLKLDPEKPESLDHFLNSISWQKNEEKRCLALQLER